MALTPFAPPAARRSRRSRPSLRSGRAFAAVAGFVAVGLLVTLALAQPWQPDPAFAPSGPSDDPSNESVREPAPFVPPDPPDDLSNESVREYALDYERALVDHRLSTDPDVDDYGFGEPTMSKRASVTHRTTEGVYVRVQRPYWYETGPSHADTASRATYFVTRDAAWRVDERPVGTPAVETYRGPDADTTDDSTQLDRPVAVRVLHFGTTERSVTLDLTYRGNGAETVWDRRVTAPANATVALHNALARTGTYEITVGVGERTVTREFEVSGNQSAAVVVYVGPGDRVVVRRGTGWP